MFEKSSGSGTLHYACINGRAKVLHKLIKLGASLNKANKLGHTVLHIAAMQGDLTLVELLCENYADGNQRDN